MFTSTKSDSAISGVRHPLQQQRDDLGLAGREAAGGARPRHRLVAAVAVDDALAGVDALQGLDEGGGGPGLRQHRRTRRRRARRPPAPGGARPCRARPGRRPSVSSSCLHAADGVVGPTEGVEQHDVDGRLAGARRPRWLSTTSTWSRRARASLAPRRSPARSRWRRRHVHEGSSRPCPAAYPAGDGRNPYGSCGAGQAASAGSGAAGGARRRRRARPGGPAAARPAACAPRAAGPAAARVGPSAHQSREAAGLEGGRHRGVDVGGPGDGAGVAELGGHLVDGVEHRALRLPGRRRLASPAPAARRPAPSRPTCGTSWRWRRSRSARGCARSPCDDPTGCSSAVVVLPLEQLLAGEVAAPAHEPGQTSVVEADVVLAAALADEAEARARRRRSARAGRAASSGRSVLFVWA